MATSYVRGIYSGTILHPVANRAKPKTRYHTKYHSISLLEAMEN